ncbi:DNA-binding response regulator [Paenibacillus sp. PK3_47]|uniref:response regulator transcription factor n=1 Tax=Paenibacillus sp. PK3_47 TaxID=2072642 RepID=UPI00201E28D5|nr:response regulator [Paenibacillus sp. PK3_47]UQZ35458.1 DNA-binding response regulator [Paenibacillus sp. PK3_47]
MYRLLVVDDEEIITDTLHEVLTQFMPEKLDVCKAYSSREALVWMERTRIDMVLTDIRMPGMSGLELSENIRNLWPRCKIIFLTGYSEFDYAYQAIQMTGMRYVLKTEGYDKVVSTVEETLREIEQSRRVEALIAQSTEHMLALELTAQGGYFRHLLQDSRMFGKDTGMLEQDFSVLNIGLDPRAPVTLILGRPEYQGEASYTESSRKLTTARLIWDSYLAGKTQHVGIEDKYGGLLWFLQPASAELKDSEHQLKRYLEGTLELIQEACLEELQLPLAFTAGVPCSWDAVSAQYERLRQVQQIRAVSGSSVVWSGQSGTGETREELRISSRTDIIAAHLEAGRKEKLHESLNDTICYILQGHWDVNQVTEAYYTLALVFLSCINRWGLQKEQLGDYSKLMRLDEHASIAASFQYLSGAAAAILDARQSDEHNQASNAIERICHYIDNNLGEDLSLVRLAELNHFNPTYLSRFFKQEQGINLSDYIDECRVRRAMEMLKAEGVKIREVAAAVGYEAAHSFTRFFKKVTGMTPQEYRDTFTNY